MIKRAYTCLRSRTGIMSTSLRTKITHASQVALWKHTFLTCGANDSRIFRRMFSGQVFLNKAVVPLFDIVILVLILCFEIPNRRGEKSIISDICTFSCAKLAKVHPFDWLAISGSKVWWPSRKPYNKLRSRKWGIGSMGSHKDIHIYIYIY